MQINWLKKVRSWSYMEEKKEKQKENNYPITFDARRRKRKRKAADCRQLSV
jgi:hypothetical protein